MYEEESKQLGTEGAQEFMNQAVGEDNNNMFPDENAEESSNYDPGAKYVQRMLNLNSKITKSNTELLKEDGDFGPKSMVELQRFLKKLPPNMKKFAVNSLYKEFNRKDNPEVANQNAKDTREMMNMILNMDIQGPK
jgi:glucan phosphorylase